jgi:uncharacterized DUF497 family protein
MLKKIRWTQNRIEHIAKHGIIPEEVEEAVFEDKYSTIEMIKVAERNSNEKIYRVLGVTEVGRYIAFFFIYEGNGVGYPLTARDMDHQERRRYNARRKK